MNQLMILLIIFLTESSMAKNKVRLIMFSTQPLAAKSSCIPGKSVGAEIVALNLAFKSTGGEIVTHTRGQSICGKIVTQPLFVNPSRFHDIIVQVVTQSTLFSTYVKWHYVQQYTRQASSFLYVPRECHSTFVVHNIGDSLWLYAQSYENHLYRGS